MPGGVFFIRKKSEIYKIEENESGKEPNMGPKRTKRFVVDWCYNWYIPRESLTENFSNE